MVITEMASLTLLQSSLQWRLMKGSCTGICGRGAVPCQPKERSTEKRATRFSPHSGSAQAAKLAFGSWPTKPKYRVPHRTRCSQTVRIVRLALATKSLATQSLSSRRGKARVIRTMRHRNNIRLSQGYHGTPERICIDEAARTCFQSRKIWMLQ